MSHIKKNYICLLLTLEYVFTELKNQPMVSESKKKITAVHKRIMGSRSCDNETYSFMVSLQYENEHFCAGTLVNSYWVLTAAQCCKSETIYAVAGRNTPDQNTQSVRRQILHPQFDNGTLIHNIALLLLTGPIKKSKYISYVVIPIKPITEKINEVCPEVLVMGWGQLMPTDNAPSKILQCVELPELSREKCQNYLRYDPGMFSAAVCTLSTEKNPCIGDLGGPLICQKYELQLAVISFRDNCPAPSNLTIYTRVDQYTNFIEHTLTNVRINSKSTSRRHSCFIVIILILVLLFNY